MTRIRWSIVILVSCQAAAAAAQEPVRTSLSLEEALRLAQPASEAVAIAGIGVDRAQGERIAARSQLFPQLNGSFSYNRQLRSQFSGLLGDQEPDTSSAPPPPTSCDAFAPDPTRPVAERIAALEQAVECATTVDPFASFGSLPFGRANTYTLGLSARQLVFDGGAVGGQIRAATAARTTAEIGLSSARAQLILDVVQAYYDAALSERLLSIAEATLAQADTTLTQTRLRREVGTAPEFDLLRASVARDNQRPVVIEARTRRDLASIRLRQLLNLPLEGAIELTTDLADTTFATVPTLAALTSAPVDTVAEHRATVRQASQAILAQEGLDRVAGAERLPQVALTSQFSRIAYPSRGLPGWNEFVTDWSVALGVQIPIFTGGRLRGSRMQARANLEEAKLRHRQITESAQLDSRSSLADLEAAVANWEASQGTATQAQRAYQIADIRFREGLSTQTELLDARIALQQAETNRAQAARDYQVARVRVALLPDLPLGGVEISTPTRAAMPAPRPQPATPVTTGGPTLP